MVWILWAVIAWLVFSVLVVVSVVGQPRKPITAGTAAWTVVIYGAIIAALVATTFQLA